MLAGRWLLDFALITSGGWVVLGVAAAWILSGGPTAGNAIPAGLAFGVLVIAGAIVSAAAYWVATGLSPAQRLLDGRRQKWLVYFKE